METEKIIVDDTYGFDIREPRLYLTYAPTLRSERVGVKVIEIIYENDLQRSADRAV